MGIVSGITRIDRPETILLSVRARIDFANYAEHAGAVFDRLNRHVREHGVLYAGPPFACFHNADLADLDVEIGFPLAAACPDGEGIGCRALPRGKAVEGIFLGPYEESDPLMEAIFAWIGARGLTPAGPIWNHYLNDTGRPPEQFLTRITVDLAD